MAGALETRAWEKTSAPLDSRLDESLQLLNLHQQNEFGGYDDALGSPLAADYLLGQAGMSEKSAAEIGLAENHHIVTTYEGSGEFAQRSQQILANARIDLEDPANLTDVSGHYGPHPPEYHEAVFNALNEATQGLQAGSDEYIAQVKSTLLDLKNALANPDNSLTKLITQ